MTDTDVGIIYSLCSDNPAVIGLTRMLVKERAQYWRGRWGVPDREDYERAAADFNLPAGFVYE